MARRVPVGVVVVATLVVMVLGLASPVWAQDDPSGPGGGRFRPGGGWYDPVMTGLGMQTFYLNFGDCCVGTIPGWGPLPADGEGDIPSGSWWGVTGPPPDRDSGPKRPEKRVTIKLSNGEEVTFSPDEIKGLLAVYSDTIVDFGGGEEGASPKPGRTPGPSLSDIPVLRRIFRTGPAEPASAGPVVRLEDLPFLKRVFRTGPAVPITIDADWSAVYGMGVPPSGNTFPKDADRGRKVTPKTITKLEDPPKEGADDAPKRTDKTPSGGQTQRPEPPVFDPDGSVFDYYRDLAQYERERAAWHMTAAREYLTKADEAKQQEDQERCDWYTRQAYDLMDHARSDHDVAADSAEQLAYLLKYKYCYVTQRDFDNGLNSIPYQGEWKRLKPIANLVRPGWSWRYPTCGDWMVAQSYICWQAETNWVRAGKQEEEAGRLRQEADKEREAGNDARADELEKQADQLDEDARQSRKEGADKEDDGFRLIVTSGCGLSETQACFYLGWLNNQRAADLRDRAQHNGVQRDEDTVNRMERNASEYEQRAREHRESGIKLMYGEDRAAELDEAAKNKFLDDITQRILSALDEADKVVNQQEWTGAAWGNYHQACANLSRASDKLREAEEEHRKAQQEYDNRRASFLKSGRWQDRRYQQAAQNLRNASAKVETAKQEQAKAEQDKKEAYEKSNPASPADTAAARERYWDSVNPSGEPR